MKKLLLLSACLLALGSSPVMAQTGTPAVAVVRNWANGLASGHLLIDRDGKTEQVDYNAATTAKGVESEAEAVRQVVAKLYQEGYSLKASLSPNLLIFVKGQ
ncbi:MAG: hypothetical protein ACRYFV_15870 [Janthinobacterium lividum]